MVVQLCRLYDPWHSPKPLASEANAATALETDMEMDTVGLSTVRLETDVAFAECFFSA